MYQPSQALLDRQVHFESGGNPNAVSSKGAIGLAQIMPATAAQYGVPREQLFNPEINLWVQRRYMTDLLNRYQGDVHKAVAAYYAGPGSVDKGRSPSGTQQYVSNLLGGFSSAASRLFGGGRIGEGTADETEEEPDEEGSELVKQAVKNRLAQFPPPTGQQQQPVRPHILKAAIQRMYAQQPAPQYADLTPIIEMVKRLRLGAVQQPQQATA
jgi:hypothetical protein